MHLDSLTTSSVTVTEMALLIQWILERRGLETQGVVDRTGRLDLELTNEKHRRSEFARFYYGERGVPINALWDLLNMLRGTQYARIYCFTLGSFSNAQRRTQGEFPLALKLVEREVLERYLREAQRSYRAELERRSTGYLLAVPGTRKPKTLLQRLLMWLRGSS